MTSLDVTATRLPGNPVITPRSDARIGSNINGPSLIRAPEWLPNRRGTYYLYFAHHQGSFIRLAVADDLHGPWSVHPPGVLDLADSYFTGHIASPDVHVDHEQRAIRMYYHGPNARPRPRGQSTRVANSCDGLRFEARPDVVASQPYLRTFAWCGHVYGISMIGGIVWRSPDGVQRFEHQSWPEPHLPTLQRGQELEAGGRWPGIFPFRYRHGAVWRSDATLLVIYSIVGDNPERLVYSTIDLTPDWEEWTATPPRELLRPETRWEGADLPPTPSEFGLARKPVRQLRDPAIFEDDDGSLYLAYSVAGESGIAIAQLDVRSGTERRRGEQAERSARNEPPAERANRGARP